MAKKPIAQKKEVPPVVRFAPSPTGGLHIGGIRTALYNYLFAKKTGGKFIFRLEDTDNERFNPAAEQYIKDSFKWLGIEFDEDMGAQSSRLKVYEKFVHELLEKKNPSGNKYCYISFDTEDEIANLRKEFESRGQRFVYNSSTRMSLRNSLTLSESEVSDLLKTNTPYTVRFFIPENKRFVFTDMIKGCIGIDDTNIDDFVVWISHRYCKDGIYSGGTTYHLANVIDDHLIGVTHVIRGDEWVNSTPKHILLYESFGWDIPQFCHLAPILNPVGTISDVQAEDKSGKKLFKSDGSILYKNVESKKLSKRDARRLGIPVFPLNWEESTGFKEMGFTPQGLLNYLYFVGFTPDSKKEILNMDEMICLFDLKKVHSEGGHFDMTKARFINSKHIKDVLQTEEDLKNFLSEETFESILDKPAAINIALNRSILTTDIQKVLGGVIHPQNCEIESELKSLLKKGFEFLKTIEESDLDNISCIINDYATQHNIEKPVLYTTLRFALIKVEHGVELKNIFAVIGKTESMRRITNFTI